MSRVGRVVMGTLQGSALVALGFAPLALPALHMLAEVGFCASASQANPPLPCQPWVMMRGTSDLQVCVTCLV